MERDKSKIGDGGRPVRVEGGRPGAVRHRADPVAVHVRGRRGRSEVDLGGVAHRGRARGHRPRHPGLRPLADPQDVVPPAVERNAVRVVLQVHPSLHERHVDRLPRRPGAAQGDHAEDDGVDGQDVHREGVLHEPPVGDGEQHDHHADRGEQVRHRVLGARAAVGAAQRGRRAGEVGGDREHQRHGGVAGDLPGHQAEQREPAAREIETGDVAQRALPQHGRREDGQRTEGQDERHPRLGVEPVLGLGGERHQRRERPAEPGDRVRPGAAAHDGQRVSRAAAQSKGGGHEDEDRLHASQGTTVRAALLRTDAHGSGTGRLEPARRDRPAHRDRRHRTGRREPRRHADRRSVPVDERRR